MDTNALPDFSVHAAQIDALAVEESLPGAIVGIVRHGELVWSHTTGETRIGNGRAPTATSVFRIASMTKSFTAASVLLLRDRGSLVLDTPIREYLPWTTSIGSADPDRLTVRALLTMNGGFPTDDPWGDRQENLPIGDFDELVRGGLSFARAPGTGFEYSNLGYALLGRIVSRVSGIDYLEFVSRELLEPLGMEASRFDSRSIDDGVRAHGYARIDDVLVPEPAVNPGAFSPMGGLHSSIDDLVRWVRGFSTADGSESPHPLGAASRREMQVGRTFAETLAVAGDESLVAGTKTTLYGYGLMETIDSRLGRFVHHSGGYPGFGSHMRWHPASGFGIVALANRTYAPMRSLAIAILDDVVAKVVPSVDVIETLWPETREAMDVAERLLRSWDDRLADAHFAVNVDLDTPRLSRSAAMARLRESLGDFTREPASVRSTSPCEVTWTVRGHAGSVTLDLLMSPERPPRIQSLGAEINA